MRTRRIVALAVAGCFASDGVRASAAAPRPNVVQIIADDMGWGEVGYNGQLKIKTPQLDALRASGISMVNGYCPAAVCAPTRAAMLTGFHNGRTFVDRNGVDIDTGFRFEDVMIGEVLKQGGYRTGVIGKWGLGGSDTDNPPDRITTPSSLPNNHGYDEFYGYLSHTRAHNYFHQTLWQTNPSQPDGVELVSSNGVYTHDLFQQRALDFITSNAGGSEPFYLEFAPTIPHDNVADIAKVAGWDAQYPKAQYSSWTDGQRQYAAMITRMDDGIGQLMARLNDPNGDGSTADSIAANTLVMFTSDNGPVNSVSGSVNFFDSNGPYIGGKRDLTEGGLRTPWIMSWPGVIEPGSTNDRVVELTDLLPTLAELAGVTQTPVGMDGVSFAPVITGQGLLRDREYWIYEGHESKGGPLGQGAQLWAIRQGNWKLIKWGDGTYRLFNLAIDPTEQSNVVAANPTIKSALEDLALFEGVEQPTDYAMTYRTWTGVNGSNVAADASWSGSGTPDLLWSAVVDNTTGGSATANVTTNVSFLGFGVRGSVGTQRVLVGSGATLTGRNEIRVSAGGRLSLSNGSLASNRWTDVLPGGTIDGHGTINSALYNAGTVAATGGTLTLLRGGAHSGAFSAAAGATLVFGGGTHRMNAGATLAGPGDVHVTAGQLHFATPSATIADGMKLTVNGGSVSATALLNRGTINIDSGQMQVSDLRVAGNGKMKLAAGLNQTLVLSTLDVSDAGQIDLTSNRMIIRNGEAGTFTEAGYGGVSAMVQSGYNDGSWDGPGIMTSLRKVSNAFATIAVASAGDALSLEPGATATWSGQIVSSDDVLVMYTYLGDANLDGRIDADDYSAIDLAYRSNVPRAYFRGDFNYDGAIDADDYSWIDVNYRSQGAPFEVNPPEARLVAVPEPAGISVLAALLVASARRSRRR